MDWGKMMGMNDRGGDILRIKPGNNAANLFPQLAIRGGSLTATIDDCGIVGIGLECFP